MRDSTLPVFSLGYTRRTSLEVLRFVIEEIEVLVGFAIN
jgi:hypothetical protein